MSVQASRAHYCEPKQDDLKEYTHVEIGRISETESLLLMYAENGEYPTETAKIGTLTAENGTLKKEIEAKSEETKRTDWKKNFLNRFLRKY